MWPAIYAVCCAVSIGGAVFYALVLIGLRRYRRESPAGGNFAPPISILKPLAGLEEGLEENLRSFLNQDYPEYQILFAVRSAEDPAAAIVRRLLAEHPERGAELIVAGEPGFPNAKVWSLSRMAERARHEILVISDSDIRARPGYLRGIAADFADPSVAVSSCPYRVIPGDAWWSQLEALTINTEFWSGVLVARMLEGMQFAVGPTMSIRKTYLDEIGGFPAVGAFLAEDFVLGQWAGKHGYKGALSGHVVDHRIAPQPFWASVKHRIRWARSTRRSRPWGYVGQVFTNPLPFAMPLLAGPAAPLAAVVIGGRAAVVAAVALGLLRDPLARRRWWLVPLADVASLMVWVLGFFGNTVEWRGRRYRLFRDGRLEPVSGSQLR